MKNLLPKIKNIIKVILGMGIFLSILFIPAGTIFWPEAWIIFFAFFAAVFALVIWLRIKDPALLKERSSRKKEGKLWDKILLSIYTIFLFLMLITSGLDAVRWQWSKVPLIIKITGFMGFIPAVIIIFKVFKLNTFASKVVRVQKDRSQQVIKSGPYKYVRHPMYACIIIFILCLPLALGSFFALIFAGLIIIVFFIRTYLEDTTLQKELTGYKEYTEEVRYRLIPGIW